MPSRTFFHRIIRAAALRGSSRRSQRVSGSIAGRGTTKVGERCSIVTCAACLGQRGHQRHRGRAAADHDDALAGIVEVLGPELRMDEAAAIVLLARP